MRSYHSEVVFEDLVPPDGLFFRGLYFAVLGEELHILMLEVSLIRRRGGIEKLQVVGWGWEWESHETDDSQSGCSGQKEIQGLFVVRSSKLSF